MNVQPQTLEAADSTTGNLHTDDIAWTEICPGAFVKVLAVDEKTNCVDTLTKFEPNFTFNRHRHLSQRRGLGRGVRQRRLGQQLARHRPSRSVRRRWLYPLCQPSFGNAKFD